jgi:hypothetical protein
MSKLLKRNCYNCVHHSVCSFTKGMERLLHDHMGWYDVDMPSPPDWQRAYETLAKMCLRYVAAKES